MSRILTAFFLLVFISTSLIVFPLNFVLAAPVPLLKIESPTDGQVVESFIVNLNFSLKNFTLKDFHLLPKNNPNQGHLHIWLDQEERNRDNAIMYYKAPPYTFADVSAGKHTLVVELVGNDHTSFDPQIIQTIKFETKAPAGSEAAPVKPTDAPKVAVSTTGEVPVTAPSPDPNRGFLPYLASGFVTLILGFVGVFLLKRSGSGPTNTPIQ